MLRFAPKQKVIARKKEREKIKEKNQMIKKQKEQKRQLNKPKVKTLTQNPSNNSTSSKGFANIVTLFLIVSFVCGGLFMVVYMFIKR